MRWIRVRYLRRHRPKTHDYTVRYHGHDFIFDPINGGKRGRMQGWGNGIRAGDFLILPNPPHGTSRYRVEEIEYHVDPSDMWKAEVVFDPRS